eukprot:3287945-Alexandrium_andersonii.AAC.1
MAETLPDYLDVHLSGAPQGEPEHYDALAEHILECASVCPMDQATQSAPEGLSIQFLPPGTLSSLLAACQRL